MSPFKQRLAAQLQGGQQIAPTSAPSGWLTCREPPQLEIRCSQASVTPGTEPRQQLLQNSSRLANALQTWMAARLLPQSNVFFLSQQTSCTPNSVLVSSSREHNLQHTSFSFTFSLAPFTTNLRKMLMYTHLLGLSCYVRVHFSGS